MNLLRAQNALIMLLLHTNVLTHNELGPIAVPRTIDTNLTRLHLNILCEVISHVRFTTHSQCSKKTN